MSTIHETGTSARSAVHNETFRFKCARCSEVFGHPADSCGAGYAVRDDDSLICYACCGELDAEALAAAKPGDRFTHYLTKDGTGQWHVSNWPGTLKVRAGVKHGRHNIGRTRIDAWFSYAGKSFHAVNIGDSQIARIRALKP